MPVKVVLAITFVSFGMTAAGISKIADPQRVLELAGGNSTGFMSIIFADVAVVELIAAVTVWKPGPGFASSIGLAIPFSTALVTWIAYFDGAWFLGGVRTPIIISLLGERL